MEFVIPAGTRVVFVGDMFMSDYAGGAEATSEAIIKKCPFKIFKVHSSSLTVDMLERYPDKYWVIGNMVQCDIAALGYMIEKKLRYSVVEYDYKYCMYRSEVMHKKQSGADCDCPLRPHGILIEKLYSGAEKIFWMSEKQKEHFLSRMPSLLFGKPDQHVVISSIFSDETIDQLLELRKVHAASTGKLPIKIWAIQGSPNWIKGMEETVKWCTEKRMPVKILSNMTPDAFLKELAMCDGLVFHPLDFDTCPRVVIEAKIIGCALELNDNVQHKDEPWFAGSVEDTVAYLRGRAKTFWEQLDL
jgi:hypothetical protein